MAYITFSYDVYFSNIYQKEKAKLLLIKLYKMIILPLVFMGVKFYLSQ